MTLRGERVYVVDEVEVGTDEFEAPITEPRDTPVDNVLVYPGPRTDMISSNRPDGRLVVFTLLFPKTYSGDLTSKTIKVRGHPYKVVGSPSYYTNCPTDWNMPVEVVSFDG